MRTIVFMVCLMWGWYFFHDQIKSGAQLAFVESTAWFGVDTRPYLVAAQTHGTAGVLDTFSNQVQADTQQYMGNGTLAIANSP